MNWESIVKLKASIGTQDACKINYLTVPLVDNGVKKEEAWTGNQRL